MRKLWLETMSRRPVEAAKATTAGEVDAGRTAPSASSDRCPPSTRTTQRRHLSSGEDTRLRRDDGVLSCECGFVALVRVKQAPI